MSSSDSARMRDRCAVRAYLAIGALCVVFAAVYAQFSHGVSSPFMTCMAAIPLIGGAAVFWLMRVLHIPPIGRVAFNAYNAGIATLTMGSILRGVCDIAGTSSPYLLVFAIVGAGLAVVAGLISILSEEAVPDPPSRRGDEDR